MSTRATYRINPARRDEYARHRGITFYIHHDGYEDGAAVYFWRMLTGDASRGVRGGLAERFLRANLGAEFTSSHEAHGDTEYRYDLEGEDAGAMLKVSKLNWSKYTGGASDSFEVREKRRESCWDVVYGGTLAAFIDAHHKGINDWRDDPATEPGYTPFRQVKLNNYVRVVWMNEHTARQRLEGEYGPLHHLRMWGKPPCSMEPWAANWQSCASEVAAIVGEFPALANDETARYIATVGAKHPDTVTA